METPGNQEVDAAHSIPKVQNIAKTENLEGRSQEPLEKEEGGFEDELVEEGCLEDELFEEGRFEEGGCCRQEKKPMVEDPIDEQPKDVEKESAVQVEDGARAQRQR